MPEDYLSFDDALRELQMQEAELRALVSQGKLRAFRDENTLKFRRNDVENLRKRRETEATVVLRPEPGVDTKADTGAPPPATEEPIDLLADEEAFGYDDTAETIIGGEVGPGQTGDTDLTLGEPEVPVSPAEPATKVPTIELTPHAGEGTEAATEDTAVPTLELGEEAGGEEPGSETEVPTMVLGLDEYDDTQVATEEVATEEVVIEEGELGGPAAAGEPTAEVEEPEVPPEEEEESKRAIGSITGSSSLGTGEPLAAREIPSTLFTVMSIITAFILLVPGSIFFYCMTMRSVPKWGILQSIMEFFWSQFGLQ